MKFSPVVPPRVFEVGFEQKFAVKDCARLSLEANEQVTLTTGSGGEYDVTRKSWGFYATPSTNGRLMRFGLRSALVKNRIGQYFVMLVEVGKEAWFEEYLASERLSALCWFDNQDDLSKLDRTFSQEPDGR